MVKTVCRSLRRFATGIAIPGCIGRRGETRLRALREQLGIIEASAWANVKFPFHVIMSLLRYRKMSYRGVEKSEAQP